jgi:phosphopantothenoylcysteine decarboxylase
MNVSGSGCKPDIDKACGCTDKEETRKRKVLIGVTGSVAAIKVPELVQKLIATNLVAEIGIVPTETSLKFFQPEAVVNEEGSGTRVKVWRDAQEWSMWKGRGDPVLHIDLGKWADIMILAPLDANTLGKISNGLCDNLLTCVVRAWDLKARKPLIFCPAMNTKMWEHPMTSVQIDNLVRFGYHLVPPVEKTLMCGDTGIGAMAVVDTILQAFAAHL